MIKTSTLSHFIFFLKTIESQTVDHVFITTKNFCNENSQNQPVIIFNAGATVTDFTVVISIALTQHLKSNLNRHKCLKVIRLPNQL